MYATQTELPSDEMHYTEPQLPTSNLQISELTTFLIIIIMLISNRINIFNATLKIILIEKYPLDNSSI